MEKNFYEDAKKENNTKSTWKYFLTCMAMGVACSVIYNTGRNNGKTVATLNCIEHNDAISDIHNMIENSNDEK